jgi:hypothetical protein
MKMGLIVEGHGEVASVPRILQELAPTLKPLVLPPHRVSRGQLVKEEGLQRAIEFMARKVGDGGRILVLLDVLFADGSQDLSLDARLEFVEALFEGLEFTRVDLTFSRVSIRSDGRQGEGCASLTLHWLAPDGGEARVLFSHVKGDVNRDMLVSWARALSRERSWPR